MLLKIMGVFEISTDIEEEAVITHDDACCSKLDAVVIQSVVFTLAITEVTLSQKCGEEQL